MMAAGDKSQAQHEIRELFGCKLGIESDKITERKVSANPVIEANPWRALNGNHCLYTCMYMHNLVHATRRNQLPAFVSYLNWDMWWTTW